MFIFVKKIMTYHNQSAPSAFHQNKIITNHNHPHHPRFIKEKS